MSILDNPAIEVGDWHRVRSHQLDLRSAAAMIAGPDRHRTAALAELEPEAVAALSDGSIREAGAASHVDTAVPWASIEELLLSGAGDKHSALRWVTLLGQDDIAARWKERWRIEVSSDAAIHDDLILRSSWMNPIAREIAECMESPGLFLEDLTGMHHAAKRQLGLGDPQYLFISRILGLVAGATGAPEWAVNFLGVPAALATRGGSPPLIVGAELELSVVQTMLTHFEDALAHFERASTTDSDYPDFERFHSFTRAALGLTRLDTDRSLWAEIHKHGRELLQRRLERLTQPSTVRVG